LLVNQLAFTAILCPRVLNAYSVSFTVQRKGLQLNLFHWKQEDKEIGEISYFGVNITKSWLGGGGGKQIFLRRVVKKLISAVIRICEISDYL
jgi:hypothetical protein